MPKAFDSCPVLFGGYSRPMVARAAAPYKQYGGRILITTPNGAYFRNKLPTHSQIQDFTALEKQQFQPDADGHLFLITPQEMESLAHQAGLEVERMVLWGTPAVTGHARLALLSTPAACWGCYQLERLSQSLPFSMREKACFSLFIVLTIS